MKLNILYHHDECPSKHHHHNHHECDCHKEEQHHEHHECSGGHDHKHHQEHHECSCENHHEHHHHEHGCACGHDHDEHDCGCGCGHSHASDDEYVLHRIVISVVILTLGLMTQSNFQRILFFAVFLISGFPIFKNALHGISHKSYFDENTLMAIASIGAMLIGEYFEGCIVLLLYTIGEYLQSLAVSKSNKSIQSLIAIKPDFARVKVGEEWKILNPKDVSKDSIIQVLPNERIPLDGIILSGHSNIDKSSITGESVPVFVSSGDTIPATAINLEGILEVQVSKTFKEGTYSNIERMINEAKQNKAKSEEFIKKFAKVYTPIVTLLAFIIAFVVPFIFQLDYKLFIYKGLEFLVCSCPCALVLAIPLSYFAGIGGLSKKGILVKGSNHIETLSKVNTIYFDKTNTLTKGKFKVIDYTSDNALKLAAHAEFYSNHPIAKAILEAYPYQIDESKISLYKVIAGEGITYQYEGATIYVGNERLLKHLNLHLSEEDIASTIVLVAKEDEFIGKIYIQDEIKEDSYFLADELKKLGIVDTAIISGDQKAIVEDVQKKCKLKKAYSQLLPEEKLQILKEHKKGDKVLMYVGDGINDSPSLALADLGVSMGQDGSDIAIETSDIVIMNDKISSVSYMIQKARKIQSIVHQNIIFSIGIKIIVLIAITFVDIPMALPIFADVGVCLLAVLNSLRAMA